MNESGTFRFLAVDASGKRCTVEISAGTLAEANRKLRKDHLIPLKELKKAERKFLLPSKKKKRKKFDVLSFTSKLSPLLDANVPLEKALAVMEEGATDRDTHEILFELRRKLHEGRRFSELLRESEGNFPEIYSGLVEAGEESGNLARVIGELRRFLAESKEFKDFVVTSSIYPVSVIIVTLSVVIILFTVFVPRFAQVFADMGKELPALTQMMLNVSHWMTTYWYVLLVPFLLYPVWKLVVRRSAALRLGMDRFWLKLPLIGPLTISVQMGNFMQAMAIMTGSHVHLMQCLKISLRMITNAAILKSFATVSERLRDGGKISEVLGSVPYLPAGSAAMLKVAEESGEIGEMFARIAAEEQGATRLKFKRLMVLMEPVIIIVLAVMVMLVVLAVFTAIWKMNSIR